MERLTRSGAGLGTLLHTALAPDPGRRPARASKPARRSPSRSPARSTARHLWRRAGLLVHVSERESRLVLWLGCISCLVYAGRPALAAPAHAWAVGYVPILGAALEIAVVFLAWVAVLEAWRVARPIARERRL